MYKLSIAVMLAAIVATSAAQAGPLSTGPTAGKVEIPSCEVFMKRLRDAGKVLTFPLPPVKIERKPYADDRDAFWVSYEFGRASPARWWDVTHEGSLSCKDGKFVDYQMDYPFTDEAVDAMARRSQIASATVYAFTGLQPRQVIKIVNDGLSKRPKSMQTADGHPVETSRVPLTKDVDANFGFSDVMIDAYEVNGK